MKRLLSLLFCFFLFPVIAVFPQEAAAPGAEGPAPAETIPAEEVPPEASSAEETPAEAIPADEGSAPTGAGNAAEQNNPETAYVEMDIKTSTMTELAAWCRDLGLSEGGTREELASRLRSHYKLVAPEPVPAGQRVITIESARSTEYFTLDIVDEEYARLKGDVIISLKDGDAVHRVKAWEILYNRTRNVMTATGNVEYVKEDGDTVETFKGDSITVNLDNWASIFMDGVSEKSVSGSATAYRFAGTVISRNSEEVTVLTGAEITNPNNAEAFWSLHASKLWLLPGNDFAFLNAVLKVGNIPLLYIPFFYYPADEIVFHPVLGTRSREGTFLQTTTYILGRPKTSAISENSLTRIFGSNSDSQGQTREGVFLRKTGEKRQDPGDTSLSVLFDAYVNLGMYLGTELTLPRKGMLGETSISAGIGFTRNIYPMSGSSTPFPDYDGVSEWNDSKLFSLDTPFRYRFNMTGSLSIKNGSLSWALPLYSDPYVDRDFMKRAEVLDWLAMLRDGATASEEDDTGDSYLSSYEWKLNGSFNPPVTALAPYISSFSVSSFSSSMLFNNRTSSTYTGPATPPNPGKLFFFPSRFTMYSVNLSAAGTPFKTGAAALTQAQTQPASGTAAAAPGDALLPDSPIPPWETNDPEEDDASIAGVGASGTYSIAPPALSQRFDLPSAGGPQLSFDYRLSPTSTSEMMFMSSDWKEQEDIKWSDISSVFTRLRSDTSLGISLNHSTGGAYSASFRVNGTGSWQDYMFLNEDATEYNTDAKVQAAKNRTYSETYVTSDWDFTTSIRPFFQSAVWGGSSLQYSVKGLLAKTEVDTTEDEPEWDWIFGKWDKEDLTSHQVTASLAANIMDYTQNLSLSAVLPPEDSSVSGNATFRAWITETGVSGRVQYPWEEEKRLIEPVRFTESLKFGTLGSFSQTIAVDPEEGKMTTFTSNLSLAGFTASYSMTYARPYELNPLFGAPGAGSQSLWTLLQDEQFKPLNFQLGYVRSISKKEFWNKRLSLSTNVNTSMRFDLQRYTNSRLTFTLSFTTGITNFMDLSFSTSSENAVIYRYFYNMPFVEAPEVDIYEGYESNMLRDLFNSFRFDNEELRRRSGFKLKALNVSLIHHLGDWNANLTVTMTPYRPAGSRSYEFNNELSFLIRWVPIGEIRTQIDYSQEKLTVK